MNNSTLQHIPIRFDYYLGASEFWATLFSEYLPEKTTQLTLTELCPGWSPKIILALLRCQFSGTYIGVDVSQDALDKLSQFCLSVDLPFQIQTLVTNILHKNIPCSDVIVMNHVLDDILLHAFWQDTKSSPFDDIQLLKKFWIRNEKEIEKDLPEFAMTLAEQINAGLTSNGLLFLHQYLGYQEKLHSIDISFDLSMKMHKLLVEALQDHYHFKKISNEQLTHGLIILQK